MNIDRPRVVATSLFALALLAQVCPSQDRASQEKHRRARFEKQVDELRGRLRIPGLSRRPSSCSSWSREGWTWMTCPRFVPTSSSTPLRAKMFIRRQTRSRLPT